MKNGATHQNPLENRHLENRHLFPMVAGSIAILDCSFLYFFQDFIMRLGRRQSSAETVQLIKKVSWCTGAVI